MKHLKKFNESWESGFRNKADQELCSDIVSELYPEYKKRQDNGEKISYHEFEESMKKNGATYDMFEKIMMELVEKGINFYSDEDEEDDKDSDIMFYNLN